MDNISIPSFTYCDEVRKVLTPNGPISQIISPLQELTPISIPSNYTFSIACIISGIKPSPSNRLKVTFEDPGGKVLEKFELPNCNPPKNPDSDDSKSYSMQLDVELRNVALNQAGTYGTRVTFNDIVLGFYAIAVNESKKLKK